MKARLRSGAPIAIATGDFDGDGNVDLVTATSQGGPMGVLLGAGDGSFAPVRALPDVTTYVGVAAGDLDGDGLSDLIYPAASGGVALSNGDGTFRAGPFFVSRQSPRSLALGDVDGDGRLDVVATNGTISVWLGRGDGSLVEAGSVSIDWDPESVALVDLDGDGHLDLIAGGGEPHAVAVSLGRGDGTFGAPRVFGVDQLYARYTSIATADIDGDGKLDVVAADPSNVALAVLFGDGTGGLGAPQALLPGGNVRGVQIADVDGDGVPDIVSVTSQGSVSVLPRRRRFDCR